MKILVLNCGSSSLKFQLIEIIDNKLIAKGLIEKIGTSSAILTYKPCDKNEIRETIEVRNHNVALQLMLNLLTDKVRGVITEISEIEAVGHRVVHGGEHFFTSACITDEVIKNIKECSVFAPLHNPANLMGIEACSKLIKGVRQVAVFDTAFHQKMPRHAYYYALPYAFYEKFRIRKYGFHGTSHWYVSKKASQFLHKDYKDFKVITCHLGNGGSIAAVKNGVSIDTTMGFTPLEGLIMGTRCGDIDPAIIPYIMQKENLSPKEIDDLLNKSSGLKGITKTSSDMREILEEVEANSELHKLALDMYCYRIKKYIGAYYSVLGGADAVVFTAGIGENNPIVRSMVCQGLECIGISIDKGKNEKNESVISSGKVSVLVIPTNEELAIAQETYQVLMEKQQKEASEKEELKSKEELKKLTEADKARIAIIWSRNEQLSNKELLNIIDSEIKVKISSNALKDLLNVMGFVK